MTMKNYHETVVASNGRKEHSNDSKRSGHHLNESTPDKQEYSNESWDSCVLCTHETAPKGIDLVWIECDVCDRWFHCACAQVSRDELNIIQSYHCSKCSKENGPSLYRRASKRSRPDINYRAMNEGDVAAVRRHPYCSIIESTKFTPHEFKQFSGDILTKEWAEEHGLQEPVIIPKKYLHTLDMTIPSDLTVHKVMDIVGAEKTLNVMDVPTQSEVQGWDFKRWVDYYETPKEERDRVRNVISLEFSQTKLAPLIRRPKFVRDMDWVNHVWPRDLLEDEHYPHVSLYCLMSVADSYTDFHIDFGGTSVFYHVLRGSKSFLFVPPTPANLRKYTQWCLSSDQQATFFGSLVKQCYRVDLNEGDTMIIPSSWIHAVYTPKDSLVIGGNFLTSLHIATQLKVHNVEAATKVSHKFRFPNFARVLWYAAIRYMDESKQENGKKEDEEKKIHAYPQAELDGIICLNEWMHKEVMTLMNGSPAEKKASRSSIPKEIGTDPATFSKAFAKLAASLTSSELPDWAGG